MDDLIKDENKLKEEILSGFSRGFNCAESIVVPFATALGFDGDMMKLATPFGAGIGGRRDLCGILTGGTMIIGLTHGRSDPDDVEQKTIAYKMAARYYRWFKKQGKVRCAEIVQGKFTGHTDECARLMEDAQAELLEIIRGEEDESA